MFQRWVHPCCWTVMTGLVKKKKKHLISSILLGTIFFFLFCFRVYYRYKVFCIKQTNTEYTTADLNAVYEDSPRGIITTIHWHSPVFTVQEDSFPDSGSCQVLKQHGVPNCTISQHQEGFNESRSSFALPIFLAFSFFLWRSDFIRSLPSPSKHFTSSSGKWTGINEICWGVHQPARCTFSTYCQTRTFSHYVFMLSSQWPPI